MSRHRSVRNMAYDDYDDGYDDYDDYYSEEEEEISEEAARYLISSQPTETDLSNPNVQQEEDNAAIQFLCDEFSRVLSTTLSTHDVETALADSNYNQDAALAKLRSQHPPTNTSTATSNNPLTLHTPSAIGQAVTQHSDSSPPHFLNNSVGVTQPNDVVVSSGRALFPSANNVERFNFQNPSPDDVVLTKRGRGRERTRGAQLRLPKPSSLRRPVVPPAQDLKSSTTLAVAAQEPAKNSQLSTTPAVASQEARKTKKSNNKKLRIPRKIEPRVPKSVQKNQTTNNGAQGSKQRPKQPTAAKPATLQRAKTIDVVKEAAEAAYQKLSLSVVVAGHVDAGKSTLLGHLLKLLEMKNQSSRKKGKKRDNHGMDLAWTTDQDEVERERGVTIDFCIRQFETVKDKKTISFAMLDAPGHRDFVPAMISGATQASAAVLVVDASTGEFESGISEQGQTREHAMLLKAVGISKLTVVVNKLDTVDYSQDRYNEVVSSMRTFLKANGWKSQLKFVACSGRAGVNVMEKPSENYPLSKWYKGPTFLGALENMALATEGETKERIANEPKKPTRLLVSDSFRSVSLGGVIAVTGRLLRGTIAPRDSLMVSPSGIMATVRHVEVNDARVKLAIAGVHNTPINVSLTSVPDTLSIGAGHVLCDPVEQVPAVLKFKAQIVTRNADVPLLQGSAVEVHIGGGSEAGTLHKLVSYCGKGDQSKKKPRRLVHGESAVVQVKLQRAVCMERSADLKHLGFFTLRSHGKSVAVGIVLEILKSKKSLEDKPSS